MNIPAHLARQLLETDFENICAKLQAGGTLTTAERKLMAEHAASAAAPAPADPSAPPSDPAPAPSFTLTPGAPLPAKLRDFYRLPLKSYAPLYQRNVRTIKRWVSAGRHAEPHDLPPLDNPARMAAWFRRRFPSEAVPPVMREMETEEPAPPLDTPEPSPAAPVSTGATFAPTGARITGINLDEMTLGDDEEVAQMKALVAAHWLRVKEASDSGDSDGVRRWTPIHEAAVEQLRKTKKAVADWNKQMGRLINRDLVEAELAQLIEALRIMRETMPGRVLAELQKDGAKKHRRVIALLAPSLAAAIDRVRESEGAIFQTLESFQSPDAIRDRLTLVAA